MCGLESNGTVSNDVSLIVEAGVQHMRVLCTAIVAGDQGS
jgi:hypothetical protein